MKITAVETHVLGTPWRDLTFVVLHTDEGLTGVGETRMLGHTAALGGYLAEAGPRHVVGHDPFDLEALVQRMKYGDYGRAGEIVMSGIACVEMACWDIVGKALGQPVWRLLGGKVRESIPAYANGWYTVERTPEEFAGAARTVVDRGYRALKFDPFGPGQWQLEPAERRHCVALAAAVREAVGPDVQILIEMHGRFAPSEAIRIAAMLTDAGVDPSWIEEPVPPANLSALTQVAAHTDIPIATGERIHDRVEFREIFENRSVDVIQPDIGHLGGIAETRKLAATAETHYTLIAPHNVGGPVLTAANLHLAACTPNFMIQEHFNDFADEHVKQAAPGCPPVVDGAFALPTAPGLGVELDLNFVAAHPSTGAYFDLFREGWEKREGARP
ncbi:mandelate racemase/muconate lactonizing enzyme family protein [Actinomycetospora sp. CA-084318]|uniref:mandelate racemase/muconate lactonizing enzyme family protein n=1 Tax=Actinomycetospora sp. CA-084318 TaxID=3239892 RepID=UPI003D95FEFA